MVSVMIPYSFTPPPTHYEFRIPLRVWIGIAFAILIALAVACSGAAPTPTVAPTPTLIPTSTPAPTPTQPPTPTFAPTPKPASAPTPAPASATHRTTGLIVNEPEAFDGYTLFTPLKSGVVYLIDSHGRVVYSWTMEPGPTLVKLLDDGNLLTNEKNRVFDADGNVVWEYSYPQHHDLLQLPNGSILMLSRALIPREEAIALGANPDILPCDVWMPRVVEVRPTGPADGEIVWEWSTLDHLIQDFDPDKPNYGAVAAHPERIDVNFNLSLAGCSVNDRRDWLHSNALDYNAELDQIMITIRNFSEIWIIDRSTSMEEAAGHTGGNAGKGGDLLYRWGNPRAYQRGTVADQRLFRPHNAHWIPEGLPGAGNVLVFNNGNEYPGFERGYSSVDEIALPANGYAYRLDEGSAYGPNEVVWTYAANPRESFYAPTLSSAQRLPNGATLITHGGSGRIFEATREGETVWEFAAPTGEKLYRAYRYAPDHPGLRRLDLTSRQAIYAAAVAGAPVARSAFELYVTDGDLTYVKESCSQEDAEQPFFLHIAPERAEDLQQERRERGFNAIPVDFFLHGGALFDGKCVMRVPLPDYPVAAVRTGQRKTQGGANLWSSSFRLNPESHRAAYRAALASEPVARSVFTLYLLGDNLAYAKERCGQEDTQDRFFLHIVPERADDLQPGRREYGFNGLDFDFFARGALFAGRCVAVVPLPDYPVASVRTGQHISGVRELWEAEFAVRGRFPLSRE